MYCAHKLAHKAMQMQVLMCFRAIRVTHTIKICQKNNDFRGVMKFDKDTHKMSETHPRAIRSSLELIWDVNVTFFDKTYFSTPELGQNVPMLQRTHFFLGRGVWTIRKSIKNHGDTNSGRFIWWS